MVEVALRDATTGEVVLTRTVAVSARHRELLGVGLPLDRLRVAARLLPPREV
jgi:hypothetical protein